MEKFKQEVLDSIDAFYKEASMFKELEYEFFQEREEISQALNQAKDSPFALDNKKHEAYNTLLEYGYDLLLHGLTYMEYRKKMKNHLMEIDNKFIVKIKELSEITKEKKEKYDMLKNGLKQSLSK